MESDVIARGECPYCGRAIEIAVSDRTASGSDGPCNNHPECLVSERHDEGPDCYCVYYGCPGGAIIVEPCA